MSTHRDISRSYTSCEDASAKRAAFMNIHNGNNSDTNAVVEYKIRLKSLELTKAVQTVFSHVNMNAVRHCTPS